MGLWVHERSVNPPLGSSPFRQERQEALVALCCPRGFGHRGRHSLQYGGCASRTPDRHLSIRTAAPRALSRLSIATYTTQRGCLSGEAATSRRIGRGTRNCRALVVVSRRWKAGGPLIMDALSACGSVQIVPQTRRPALEGWNEVLSKLGPFKLNEWVTDATLLFRLLYRRDASQRSPPSLDNQSRISEPPSGQRPHPLRSVGDRRWP